MNVLTGIFLWLVAASLRASLLAVAVFAFQLALGRKLSAGWRYALWLPVVLVFVLPVLPASRWSFENRFALLMQATLPMAAASLRTHIAVAITAVSSVLSVLGRYPLVTAAWLLGVSTIITVAWVGYRRTMRRIATDAIPVDPVLASEIGAAAQQVGLRVLPRVIVSTAVESPAVTGLIRPILLLPVNFPGDLSPVEARLILLHELTHLRRHDLPLNWVLCVLQALHWFNPLLWFAFGRLRADREAACDAQVLAMQTEDCRAEYGYALLKLHRAVPLSGLSLGFAGLLKPDTLRARVLAITRHRQVHPAWNAIGAVVIAGLALAGVTHAPSTEGSAAKVGLAENRQDGAGNRWGAMRSDSWSGVVDRWASMITGTTDGKMADAHIVPSIVRRGLYGQGSAMKEGRERQLPINAAQTLHLDLPDWWPAAISARILLNSSPHPRRALDEQSHRSLAALSASSVGMSSPDSSALPSAEPGVFLGC